MNEARRQQLIDNRAVALNHEREVFMQAYRQRDPVKVAMLNEMLRQQRQAQSRWFMMMAVMTVLGLVFIGAAAWGMGRQAEAYRAEARV